MMRDDFYVKPSMAPFVFETALMQGFAENGIDLQVRSFPVIPALPKSKYVAWGSRQEKLEAGFTTRWIPAINIVGIKPLCQQYTSRRMLKKWMREHTGEETTVLLYSIYQPIAKSIIAMCKKYNAKCYAIVPDLPRDMYNLARVHPIKRALSNIYVRAAEKVQGHFDGYVYLTEAMKDVINPSAPYTVVEGIANATEARELTLAEKAPGKVIMYAGALHEKYGVKNLIEAFLAVDRQDARLWLFGSGDFESAIHKYTAQDSRIHYFGSVSRAEVLERERQATLLVNVRNDQDDFTKYSFPSKVIEYMLSGTPMLMTKLPGIPNEYYDFAYTAESSDVQTLAKVIERICEKTPEELLAFGARAQNFIATQKNGCVQTAKIIKFVQQQERS